jgi:hypothetical protein
MIELEKLKAVDHIVVHDNCPDGVASAMILHDALPNAKVTFCQYETELHKTIPAKPGMLFADFSPKLSRVKEFLDVGAIVLDHHGGPAAEATKQFAAQGLGAFADEKLEPGVSGAMLAFREVWRPLSGNDPLEELVSGEWPRTPMRTLYELAKVAGIRDTWQKDDPRWREACEQAEAVRFWPWEKVAATPWDRWGSELLAIGPILFDRNLKHVQKCIEGSYKFTTPRRQRKVTVFEGLKPTSDAAEMMGPDNDLTIGLAFFMEGGEQKLIFSTRSRGAFNCQNFALAHGGGGHTKAAGFAITLKETDPHPFELVKRLVDRYEALEQGWEGVVSEPSFAKNAKDGVIVPKDVFEDLAQKHGPKVWDIRLDQYQRDNIVWLCRVAGYPHDDNAPRALEIFRRLNTGDWLGELAFSLNFEQGPGHPNMSFEDFAKNVEQSAIPRDAIDT